VHLLGKLLRFDVLFNIVTAVHVVLCTVFNDK